MKITNNGIVIDQYTFARELMKLNNKLKSFSLQEAERLYIYFKNELSSDEGFYELNVKKAFKDWRPYSQSEILKKYKARDLHEIEFMFKINLFYVPYEDTVVVYGPDEKSYLEGRYLEI